jgi:hypothetical protein
MAGNREQDGDRGDRCRERRSPARTNHEGGDRYQQGSAREHPDQWRHEYEDRNRCRNGERFVQAGAVEFRLKNLGASDVANDVDGAEHRQSNSDPERKEARPRRRTPHVAVLDGIPDDEEAEEKKRDGEEAIDCFGGQTQVVNA